jgi:serine/threonine protein kinase
VSLDFLKPCNTPNSLGCLGGYVVLDVIGRGGMGIVLRAMDSKLNRIVAIKVLVPEFAGSPQARKRFAREAQAAAAVSHDHIVTIHAVDDEGQVPYIVMECVVGQSLQQKIDKCGALGLKEILRIGLRDWRPLTSRGWCIATSSQRTFCWRMGSNGSRSPTSGWPERPMMSG